MNEKKITADNIRSYAAVKLNRLNSMQNEAYCRAELAKMRRGIGKKPGELPELWGMLFDAAPDGFIRAGTAPSKAEWALYTALTLYALHTQGSQSAEKSAYVPKRSLGTAVAMLAGRNDDGPNEAVLRRFNAMATSADMDELSWHLRGIIQLLKREGIPLDYAELAVELYKYQFSESCAEVRLTWGRDFYREYNRKYSSEAENAGKDENDEK